MKRGDEEEPVGDTDEVFRAAIHRTLRYLL